MEGDVLRQQGEYWKATLSGEPELLELPLDHPRPAEWNSAGAFVDLTLDEELTAGIEELSRRQGTTVYMTLLAAWAALLGRLSGQQDVVIGTPTANRGRSEIENLIGFFVNTLAIRVDVAGEQTVHELLARVKEQTLAAQQNQDTPFQQVVELLQPVRTLTHSSIFQVMFAWQNAPDGQLELADIEAKSLSSPRVVTKFDMSLQLWPSGRRIVGGVMYATALFERATIERHIGYLRTLLASMVADDTQVVHRLPLLSEVERRQMLYEWNDTAVELVGELCMHELFEAQVRRVSQTAAVAQDGRELTYAELNRRADQLAHHLQQLGVRPDARVAVCTERSLEMMVGILAVLKAGGAYVPVDPTYPAERLQFMLQDCAPVVLLTAGHLRPTLPAISDAVPVLDLTDVAGEWMQQPDTNLGRETIGLTMHNLAYVIYTSGSTGVPKGVMIEHRNLANYLRWSDRAYYQKTGDGSPAIHSIGFDGLITTLFGPFVAGQTLHLLPQGAEMESLAELCSSGDIKYTLVKVTPSHLKLWNELVLPHAEPAPPLALMMAADPALPPPRLLRQPRFPP